MNRIRCSCVLLALAAALGACNTTGRQPRFDEVAMTPPELKPGDTALLTVKVKDKHDIVRKVEGILREEPNLVFRLHDDGTAGDTEAGDRTYSLQVDVPFQAPTGEFVLELTGFRADGTPVPVKNAEGVTVPLSATLPVVIRQP